jgi:hypothetical protein
MCIEVNKYIYTVKQFSDATSGCGAGCVEEE